MPLLSSMRMGWSGERGRVGVCMSARSGGGGIGVSSGCVVRKRSRLGSRPGGGVAGLGVVGQNMTGKMRKFNINSKNVQA